MAILYMHNVSSYALSADGYITLTLIKKYRPLIIDVSSYFSPYEERPIDLNYHIHPA